MYLAQSTQFIIKPLLIISLLLLSLISFSQGDSAYNYYKKIPEDELKTDLSMLKDSLEIIHPALYRFTSRRQFNVAYQEAVKQVDRPLTQTEFYGIVAPLISKVGDIHTTIEPSDEALNYLATNAGLFPFDVRIIDKKTFIVSNNSNDIRFAVGSQILKINDQPIDKVLDTMRKYFSDEGHNQTLQIKRVEQRFAFHYQLVFGYSKSFDIEYISEKGKNENGTVQSSYFSAIQESRAKNKSEYPLLRSLFPQPPYLDLALDKEKNMAVLTIKWFQNDVLQSSGVAFKSFIDSAFNEIRLKNIDNLIIDIRNNGGGESENAGYLYSYLTDKPFRFLYSMEVTQKIYEDDSRRGLAYTSLKTTGKYRFTNPTIESQQFYGFKEEQPQANNFRGNVFVLIDGLTASAAPQFASLVKQHKRGILIGEPAPVHCMVGQEGDTVIFIYRIQDCSL
ncbi:MAG: S41 family peptidase [Chitinophagaceae bacterium]